MTTTAIIQARLGSTRLPGKVMLPIAGMPMLQRIVRRVERSAVDEIVIATTTKVEDDAIIQLARHLQVRTYRGSSDDVLNRYWCAAREVKADMVVRITADCPFVFPSIIDEVVGALRTADFASNAVEPRTFPKGCDVEVMQMDTLERINRMATSPNAREHVCTFIYLERPDLFVIHEVKDRDDHSTISWTVDTMGDYKRMKLLAERVAVSLEHDYRAMLKADLDTIVV